MFRIRDVTIPYGSGSADQYHWITDPDLFFGGLQEANNKKIQDFLLSFFIFL